MGVNNAWRLCHACLQSPAALPGVELADGDKCTKSVGKAQQEPVRRGLVQIITHFLAPCRLIAEIVGPPCGRTSFSVVATGSYPSFAPTSNKTPIALRTGNSIGAAVVGFAHLVDGQQCRAPRRRRPDVMGGAARFDGMAATGALFGGTHLELALRGEPQLGHVGRPPRLMVCAMGRTSGRPGAALTANGVWSAP